jgi:hypothetical protein
MPKLIVVIEIFLAATSGIDALPEHLFDRMLHARLVAGIRKKTGGGAGQPQLRVRLLQQQNASVRGDVPAGEIGNDLSGFAGWKS